MTHAPIFFLQLNVRIAFMIRDWNTNSEVNCYYVSNYIKDPTCECVAISYKIRTFLC